MKRRKRIFYSLASLILITGCAHSQIIPFQNAKTEKALHFPATNLEDIAIYRSTHPFANSIELGLISLSTDRFDLNSIFNQLRKDAAQVGAEAIVDLRTHSETHTETHWENICSPQTTCNSDGSCTTNNTCHSEAVSEEKTTYLTEGSMIRRKS